MMMNNKDHGSKENLVAQYDAAVLEEWDCIHDRDFMADLANKTDWTLSNKRRHHDLVKAVGKFIEARISPKQTTTNRRLRAQL